MTSALLVLRTDSRVYVPTQAGVINGATTTVASYAPRAVPEPAHCAVGRGRPRRLVFRSPPAAPDALAAIRPGLIPRIRLSDTSPAASPRLDATAAAASYNGRDFARCIPERTRHVRLVTPARVRPSSLSWPALPRLPRRAVATSRRSRASSSVSPRRRRSAVSVVHAPANNWNEALPVGNGYMGAMVFGGVTTEHIQFNEHTVWTGQPHSYAHEGAVKFLPEIRRLLQDGRAAEREALETRSRPEIEGGRARSWPTARGKQKQAEELAMAEFMSVPLRQKAYQPLRRSVAGVSRPWTP